MFGIKNHSQSLENENENKYTSEELMEKILDVYTTAKQSVLMKMKRGLISRESFLEDVKEHLKTHYHPGEELEATMERLEQYVFGYSILTPLIEDPDITDIKCVSYNNIRIKKNGERMGSGVSFKTMDEYKRFVQFAATKNQANISNLYAIQKFTDTKSNPNFILRFTVITELLSADDIPYMAIRKVKRDFYELPDLIEKKMLTKELAETIRKRYCSGSTLICGANSSGKTTLLNALKETIPHNVSVFVTQQSDELTTKSHPDMIFTHSLPGTGENIVNYDLKDISIAGLTMDVDFVIVGEIKGDEAMHLLNAAYSGQICSATIHANSAANGLDKIVDYALSGGSKYTKTELLKMLACFKTVIFMDKFKVEEVYAVKGWNEAHNDLDYEILFERK